MPLCRHLHTDRKYTGTTYNNSKAFRLKCRDSNTASRCSYKSFKHIVQYSSSQRCCVSLSLVMSSYNSWQPRLPDTWACPRCSMLPVASALPPSLSGISGLACSPRSPWHQPWLVWWCRWWGKNVEKPNQNTNIWYDPDDLSNLRNLVSSYCKKTEYSPWFLSFKAMFDQENKVILALMTLEICIIEFERFWSAF